MVGRDCFDLGAHERHWLAHDACRVLSGLQSHYRGAAMQVDIPDTPLAAIRAARHILLHHQIEVGLLYIHPAALYKIMEEPCAQFIIQRHFKIDGDDGDKVDGIPFKQKMI